MVAIQRIFYDNCSCQSFSCDTYMRQIIVAFLPFRWVGITAATALVKSNRRSWQWTALTRTTTNWSTQFMAEEGECLEVHGHTRIQTLRSTKSDRAKWSIVCNACHCWRGEGRPRPLLPGEGVYRSSINTAAPTTISSGNSNDSNCKSSGRSSTTTNGNTPVRS